MSTTIKIQPDLYKLSRAAGEFFVTQSQESIIDKGYFTVALSGEETPATLYSLLASDAYASRIDWTKVHIFWGDERCVPPEDLDSNYNMAKQNLLDQVPIPAENIYRIHGEDDTKIAARDYEKALQGFFAANDAGINPRFDLVLLGLGDDGHTASLFPHSTALEVEGRWVTANYVDSMRAWRITLTAEALNAARHIMFFVAGASKANALKAVLEGESDPLTYPAQLIDPQQGRLIWLVDGDAGIFLSLR
jgi:6-phosphogluconolactonase